MYEVVLFFSIYIFLTLTLTLLFRNEISEKYNQFFIKDIPKEKVSNIQLGSEEVEVYAKDLEVPWELAIWIGIRSR